jgi:dienelactone hydrolase
MTRSFALEGLEATTFERGGRSHQVCTAGSGRAVVVVHEVPGLHPGVLDFARRLVAAGYRVYLPSLFGDPGASLTTAATVRSIARICVSREFAVLADRTSPVVTWLRALAARADAECGGPGVDAVGMCLTGGFAMAMAVHPVVLAPVLSQPGLPAQVSAAKRAALGLDSEDLTAIKQRTGHGLCVLGLLFSADRGLPGRAVRHAPAGAGGGVRGHRDRPPGNRYGIPASAHSVRSPLSWSTGPGTRPAPRWVLEFLQQRLRPEQARPTRADASGIGTRASALSVAAGVCRRR